MTVLSHNPHMTPLQGRKPLLGPDPDILAGIYEPEVNLAVWQRGTQSAVNAHCKNILEGSQPVVLRAIIAADTMHDEPERVLPLGIARGPLGADIARLVDMFACLFELEKVGIRLMTLNNAMCPRFHVDRVYCRLLTTYGGPGTQWLRDTRLGRPWRDMLAAAEQGDKDAQEELGTCTESVDCQDVALLKGEAWPDNAGYGLVHRSPQVEPGRKRLLLTLDIV